MKKLTVLLIATVMSFTLKAQLYTSHIPIHLQNHQNEVISLDSINTPGNVPAIWLENCTNMLIVDCKMYGPLNNASIGANGRAIYLNNCTNVTVLHCYAQNVKDGVYAYNSRGIKVLLSQFKNMAGSTIGSGHGIQFNMVNGAGNKILNNRIDNPMGVGVNPFPNGGDMISIYKSNGTPADPIDCSGNWVRGAGTATSGPFSKFGGGVGGDEGGSYQTFQNNIFVNTGYVGFQVQGGTHITVKNNRIYSDLFPWSSLGLGSANYSGAISQYNTISNNQVNWLAGYNNQKRRDTAYKYIGGTGEAINIKPTGWTTNKVKVLTLTSSVLPAVIITYPN